VLFLNCIALWKQEPRNPARAAAMRVAPKAEPFRKVWSRFIANRRARRFLWATGLGSLAFNMQDIILEPYGGVILRMSVGATSALTAMLAGGALLAFVLAGRELTRGADPIRLAAYGALAGLPSFAAVVFAAPLDAGWLFRIGACGIGFGGGLFAVGTLYGALSPNMENLIVARVIQGLGAGMMIPVSIALISDLFPPEKRGIMIGAFSFVQLVANLLSPILGSVITKQLGWHWIFYITLVMVLIAILLVALDNKKTSSTNAPVRWTEIDILGGVLFGIFCVLTVSFSNSVSKLGQL